MKSVRIGIVSAAAVALGACSVGPDYERPDFSLPAEFSSAIPDGETPERWWEGFDDPALNDLIGRALDDNLDISAALARVDEARAFTRAERSDLFPVVDGFAQGEAQRRISGPASSGESASAGGVLSFVPDIFGGQRRRIEAARARADAQDYLSADIRRLTIAETALQYIALKRSDARLELLQSSLDLQEQTFDIVEGRMTAGLSSELDVGRAAADLARTRAQRGPLEIARANAVTALQLLLAEPPLASAEVKSGEGIPSFEGGAPDSVPADLLRRRSDIRAREAELMAVTAEIGVETADLYPSLSLPGDITADLSDVSVATPVVARLAASLNVPLFDAGRRRAEIRAAEARARAALLDYERTLLEAMREVENALVAIESYEDRGAELQRAINASERAFDQLNALYREGLATFIDILDAQRTLIDSREAYVDNEADLAAAIVALHTALGGDIARDGA